MREKSERERERERGRGRRVVITHRRVTGDSARGRTGREGGGRTRGMKVGMFVVRVIWPIKPRGGGTEGTGRRAVRG